MKKGESMNIKKLVLDMKGILDESYVSDDIFERVSYAKDPIPYRMWKKKIFLMLLLGQDRLRRFRS
jgi:hypothetical protein